MLCDAVISITVQYGSANEELVAGSQALEKKYAGRKIGDDTLLFINILTDTNCYQKTIDSWLSSYLDTLIGMVKSGKRIGMYWAIHGNMTETHPPIKELVAQTYRLYEMGLKFSKINLSACWSAGPEYRNSASKNFDYSTSMLSEFCKTLSKQMPDHKELIDGLMVAAYQSCIVMYDSADDPGYFNNLRKNPKNDFDARLKDEGVRNTFVEFGENSGKYKETHPRALPKDKLDDLAKYSADQQRLAELNKIARKKLPQMNEAKQLYKQVEKAPKELKLDYQNIERYVLQKWVLRYSAKDDQWSRVSISAYTDHQSIRDMVAIVPDKAVPEKHLAFVLPS